MATIHKFMRTLIIYGILTMFTILLTACGGSTATGPNQIHMNDSDFAQKTIIIKKGQVVTLVNDNATAHVLENGTWDSSGNSKAKQEDGAPKVDYNVGGYSNQTMGPFNTVGTFQIYCTIHPGMNLTVTVE